MVMVFIVLAILLIPLPANAQEIDEDRKLDFDSVILAPRGHHIVNHSLERFSGYYGSYNSDGLVKFGIVRTSGLESYFLHSDDPRLYSEINSSQPRWEYPCQEVVNASFVFQSLEDVEITIDYEIYQDTTPIEVSIAFNWIANYPPKLEVTATFSGGFFQYAHGLFYPLGGSESIGNSVSFNSNGTKKWTAGEYPYGKGRFDEFPDGEYNLTFQVRDVFEIQTTHYFVFQKYTQQNSVLILFGLLGIFSFAIGTERLRKRKMSEDVG
jgi:hypothetical protein